MVEAVDLADVAADAEEPGRHVKPVGILGVPSRKGNYCTLTSREEAVGRYADLGDSPEACLPLGQRSSFEEARNF
jgi:hypothetical protein